MFSQLLLESDELCLGIDLERQRVDRIPLVTAPPARHACNLLAGLQTPRTSCPQSSGGHPDPLTWIPAKRLRE